MEQDEKRDKKLFNFLTDLNLDDYKVAEKIFKKSNATNLSIIHQKKSIAKLHSIILDEDVEILNLFTKENNFSLELPNYLNPNLISEIIHYFYFREMKPLPFFEIICLLELAIFFKMKVLISKIIDFLKEDINTSKKAVFIRDSLFSVMKRSDFHVADSLQEIISICESFLLKNNHINEFLSFYVHHYLALTPSLSDLETELMNKLELMKKCQIKGDHMLKLLSFFKDRLILMKKEKEEFKDFNFKVYIEKIMEKFIKLGEIKHNSLAKHLKRLGLKISDFKLNIVHERLAAIESKESIDFTNLKEYFDQKLETIKNYYDQKIESQNIDHENQQEKIKENCNGKIKTIEENCNEKIKKIEESCNEKIKIIEENCNGKIKAFEESCNEKIKIIEENWNEKIKKIEENCNENLTNQKNDMKEEFQFLKQVIAPQIEEYKAEQIRIELEKEKEKNALLKLKSMTKTIDKDYEKHFTYLMTLLKFNSIDQLSTKLHLLYRASEHDFDAHKFHQLCDGKGKTLVLVRSKEHQRLFGGYSTMAWSSPPNGSNSSALGSFLFSLDKQTMHTIKINEEQYAICNFSSNGPIFGKSGNSDISLSPSCNSNKISYSHLGTTYSLLPSISPNTNESKSYLAGSCNFSVSEYEVFLVDEF